MKQQQRRLRNKIPKYYEQHEQQKPKQVQKRKQRQGPQEQEEERPSSMIGDLKSLLGIDVLIHAFSRTIHISGHCGPFQPLYTVNIELEVGAPDTTCGGSFDEEPSSMVGLSSSWTVSTISTLEFWR
jgi:hypothetical protein